MKTPWQPEDDVTQIFKKIQHAIRDQAASVQVICVVKISDEEEGAEELITPAEYSKLLAWLTEKGIAFSENKNGVDASQEKKLFMKVVKDHWLVFHCPKRVLMEHFTMQPLESKVVPVVAPSLS